MFYDSCPEDHATLKFNPYKPHEHLCPKCGRNWMDATFDGAWVRQFFGWLQKRVVEIGILYRLTGNMTYSQYVHKVLRHFVRNYEAYPLANNLLGPTRLFQSSFLEAFWLADMVLAYDLTRHAPAYSPQDHQEIKDLFYESCSLIRSFDEGRSNRQAFYNVGMGAVGLLYEDSELIDHVLAGPHGFAFHMRDSVLEDGLWYEGEAYHFATLDHLLDLAEMARHRGIDLYHGTSGYGSLKPMFDAPLKVMYPDLTFPSRKDSWFGRGIAYHKEIYELGYARYADEQYGRLLDHAYRHGASRDELGWRAFIYLEPELPEGRAAGLRPRESQRMPGTGIAMLRHEQGEVAVSLEYGRYGGGHGHPDRLHLNFFSDGVLWFLDPGTGWYHVPELAWYRSTLAHNTVVVDGASQDRREGSLTAFAALDGLQVAQAQVEDIYPGVSMRRTLCQGDGYLLDVVDMRSDKEHSYDWSLHSRAELHVSESLPVGAEPCSGELGEENGYEFLRDLTFLGSSPIDATLMAEGSSLRVLQLGPSKVYRARSPGIPLHEEMPFHTLIARRQARSTSFVTCYLRNSPEEVRLEEREPGYALRLGEETHWLYLNDEPGLTHLVTRDGALQALSAFGRTSLQVAGVEFSSHRPLAYAAFTLRDGRWEVSLPAEFGRVQLAASLMPRVAGAAGLSEGATAELGGGTLTLTQAPGIQVWLEDEQERLTLYAGCGSRFRFHIACYGLKAAPPELVLPQGWSLLALKLVQDGNPATWEASVRAPTSGSRDAATVSVLIAGKAFEMPLEVLSPLDTGWKVASSEGRPYVHLEVRELRGVPSSVMGEIRADWLPQPLMTFRLELEPHQRGSVHVPLPLTPVPQPEDSGMGRNEVAPPADDAWPLSGLADSAGAYWLEATLEVEDFRGRSQAVLPLYWSLLQEPAGEILLRLDAAEQAYWAEQPFESAEDISALAALSWNDEGLFLECEVRDDVHVSDANADDLYENDSLQIYLDFRANHHQSANFNPGVAAYVLAPTADKQALRIAAISGSREISNRQAKASWFTTDGLRTTCSPTQTGYRATAFLPYASLGVPPLSAGDVIGFDLAVSDNDGTWYRKFQLVWSGARGRRCYIRGSYHDPREFGYLIAGKREKHHDA